MGPSNLNDIAREFMAKQDAPAAPAFKVGDVVHLRSGSPALTVWDGRRDDGLVCVHWFAGDELRRDVFDRECLVLK